MCNYAAFSLTNALAKFNIVIEDKNYSQLVQCRALVNDTRQLQVNDIFCAIIGEHQDGRDYIEKAIALGANIILAECVKASQHGQITSTKVNNKAILVVQFYQLNSHLFELCQHYYQQPQQAFTLIGVTGTNGKTSTCQIIAKLLAGAKQSCAVIGTLGAGNVEQLKEIANTTPGATELHQYFLEFAQQGISNVAMEVSSHALSQARIKSNIIDIAVFTNLSRDHLDYHHTMQAYAEAKKAIFSGSANQIAILNSDDSQAQQWLDTWQNNQPVIVYGRKNISFAQQQSHYVVADNIQHHSHGISFELITHLGTQPLFSPLLGDFNVDNLLAVIAVIIARASQQQSNVDLTHLNKAIEQLTAVAGRMEAFSGKGLATTVVDYAHTPDALENALIACREHCQHKLWVLFGCGGDRDTGKRPQMAAVAEKYADHLVVTNDNPRTEAPELIVNDILAGCQHPEKVTIVLDRKQAVLATLAKANEGDVVLLAGKGHEDYIIIGTEKITYNEREIVDNFYQAALSQQASKQDSNKAHKNNNMQTSPNNIANNKERL